MANEKSAHTLARLTGVLAVVFALMIALSPLPAAGYTPGTGTLYSDDFEGFLDDGWEMGNGIGNPSPWTLKADATDTVLYADGIGPYAFSPTKHWGRHFVHPVTATSFEIAFEYRAELGTGYVFDLEVEQRAPALRKIRVRIDAQGALSLWRTENGAFVQLAATADGTIPANGKRWIRLAIDERAAGGHWLRVRVWSGSATLEPATWTLEAADANATLARVHRFEVMADGPKSIETWIDDLDAWGDKGNGVASSIEEVWVVELSHLDIGFTAPPDDIEAFAKSHLDLVLSNLDADPDYRFTIESGWWLDHWWRRSGESERTRMVSRLREGRLSLAASYADMHTSLMSAEEATRVVAWSSRMAREHAFPVRTWWTDDVPGSSFAVPEITAGSGMDYFIGGMNCSFGGQTLVPDHGDRPFWWVAPDGSRVLAWITFGSYAEGFDWGFSFFDQLADLYRKLGDKLPEQEEAGYPWREIMILRGFDNHYQGFHVRNLVDQWNSTYAYPRFRLATAEEFLDHMLATYGPEAFPSFSGDFGAAWAASQGNTPHTQRLVRDAHRLASAGEALVAAAEALDGGGGADATREAAYQGIIVVDEHTGAGGWPGYFTPEEMTRNNQIHIDYARDAHAAASALVDEGLDRALAEVSAVGDAVVAVNPTGRERAGFVRIALEPALFGSQFRVVDRATGVEAVVQRFEATSEILFRAEGLPAFGYKVFDLVPGAPQATPVGQLDVTTTTLENDFYRLTIDAATGNLTSLVRKATGREMIDTASAYGFNELAAQWHQQMGSPPAIVPPAGATLAVTSAGPLVAEVRVTRSGSAHVETLYRLHRGEDRVEIENALDRSLMSVVPLSQHSRSYTVAMPFDVHGFSLRVDGAARFLDPVGDAFARSSHFDWHNAQTVMAFWDDQQGVLYAMDEVAAHHFGAMKTLASSTITTDHALVFSRLVDKADEYEYEDGSIGPYTIEPGMPEVSRFTHHVRATDPTFDPAAANGFGIEALAPLPARVIARRPGDMPDDRASFFRVDAPGVHLFTAKPADVGEGVVLRMIELTGQETVARVASDVFVLDGAVRVERDEEGEGMALPTDGDGFSITLAPYETATVRVAARVLWSPITLTVTKDASSGSVRLEWTGSNAPYTVRRAPSPLFTGATTIVDEEPVNTHDDAVLDDGQTWFYLVR